MKYIYFIAGMHRSGTSYLAHVFSFIGVELPRSMQPGAPDNPKGHFESQKIKEVHDRILGKLGMSWDTFACLPEGWFKEELFTEEIDDLCELVKTEFNNKFPAVIKDPRLSMIIPLWDKVIKKSGLKVVYIIPFRNPFDVAKSLYKRNKICIDRSLLIWLNYLLTAEIFSRGETRIFIDFPEWTNDLESTVRKIEKELKIKFPSSNKENIVKANNEFEKNFVHHKTENPYSLKTIEHLSLTAFKFFRALANNNSNDTTLAEIDNLRSIFEDMIRNNFYLATENEKKIRYIYTPGIKARNTNINVLQERLEISEKQIRELESQLLDSQYELTQQNAHLNDLEEQLKLSDNKVKALNNQRKAQTEIYEELTLKYNNEQYTVIKPLYRNIYKKTGAQLRKILPHKIVDRLKKRTPSPNGIPLSLSYQSNKKTSEKKLDLGKLQKPAIDSKADIIVLSIINWDFRFQRPQHIAKGFAGIGRRVFYIEMEQSKNGLEVNEISENLFQVRLSCSFLGQIKAYNGIPDNIQLKHWIESFYEFSDIVKATTFKQIIVQHPFWWQLAKHLSADFHVTFDCMDNMAGFSNTDNFLLDLEKDMLQKADKLVVSSQYLYDNYACYQKPHLIRNAADLVNFTKRAHNVSSIKLKSIDKTYNKKTIKVGYVGAIAEWFDHELIRKAATLSAEIEYHFCGAVTSKEPSQLEKINNVFLYGEIAYEDVPGFLEMMDVLIIPFKLTPIIQACDPVKFYEYSAMGKPTVTTDLPELHRASELSFVASNSEGFVKQIFAAHEKSKDEKFADQLQTYASANTWKHRLIDFDKVLTEFPKVSIVILSYGSPEYTKAAVHSLFDGGLNYPNCEIIIVDNGSPEKSIADIKKYAAAFENVKIIENGENLGFAKGNNIGVKAATGDYVMLLNNDTAVAQGAIFAMVRHLLKNHNIGAVGPLTNNIGNEAKLFVEYENMEQMKDIARQVTTGYRGMFTPINVAAYFAVMFRKRDLEKFGLLSEEYGRGMFEDDDHCAVIKSKGYICALAEDAFVHHHLSATFSKLKKGEKESLFDNNKESFEKKWGCWQPHKYRDDRPVSSLCSGVK